MDLESKPALDMLAVICEAIRSRHLLQIQYGNRHDRVVEPHILGLSHQVILLSAYQVSGYSESSTVPEWKSFDVSKILLVQKLEDHFPRPRPEYNAKDPKFFRILCQL